jgi:hypothetical protein
MSFPDLQAALWGIASTDVGAQEVDRILGLVAAMIDARLNETADHLAALVLGPGGTPESRAGILRRAHATAVTMTSRGELVPPALAALERQYQAQVKDAQRHLRAVQASGEGAA